MNFNCEGRKEYTKNYAAGKYAAIRFLYCNIGAGLMPPAGLLTGRTAFLNGISFGWHYGAADVQKRVGLICSIGCDKYIVSEGAWVCPGFGGVGNCNYSFFARFHCFSPPLEGEVGVVAFYICNIEAGCTGIFKFELIF